MSEIKLRNHHQKEKVRTSSFLDLFALEQKDRTALGCFLQDRLWAWLNRVVFKIV